MNSKRTDDESDKEKTPEKKKTKSSKMYKRKLRIDWLHDERFVIWIEVSKVNENKAFCKFCKTEISGGITQVERHADTDKHKKNMSCVNKCSKLTDFMQSKTASLHTKKVAAAELKLCAFVAEHNLPISTLDHLSELTVF